MQTFENMDLCIKRSKTEKKEEWEEDRTEREKQKEEASIIQYKTPHNKTPIPPILLPPITLTTPIHRNNKSSYMNTIPIHKKTQVIHKIIQRTGHPNTSHPAALRHWITSRFL